jgi:replicative DNA helicase
MPKNDTPIIADAQAEETVITAILAYPEKIVDVSAVLSPEHFYWPFNRQAYAAMLSLYESGTPIDLVTVMGEVEKHGGAEDAYTANRLTELVMELSYSTVENVVTHAGTVHEKYRLRMMLKGAQEVAQAVYKADANPDQVFYSLDGWFQPAAPPPKRDTSIMGALTKEMTRFALMTEAREKGKLLGFYFRKTLDHLMRGLMPGNLITVAARPGMGKSTLAMNMMIWLAEQGVPCMFWSLEMSTNELVQKMVAYYSYIDSSRLRDCNLHEDEVAVYMEAMNIVSQLPIHIVSPADDEEVDDEAGSTIDHFRAQARLMVAQHGIKVIFLDYLQLLEGKGDNRVQELSKITRSLKRFAIRYGVVIVALSQLNRNVEGRADKVPTISDLRESGSIEQDCDGVLLLYAEDYYDPESDKAGLVDIIVGKWRHGSRGVVSMMFRKETSRFRDLEIERTYLPENIFEQDARTEQVEAVR